LGTLAVARHRGRAHDACAMTPRRAIVLLAWWAGALSVAAAAQPAPAPPSAELQARMLAVERETALARELLGELDAAVAAVAGAGEGEATAASRDAVQQHLRRLPDPSVFRRRIEARCAERAARPSLASALDALDAAEEALARSLETWVATLEGALRRPLGGSGLAERLLGVLMLGALLWAAVAAWRSRPAAQRAAAPPAAAPPAAAPRAATAVTISVRVPNGLSVEGARSAVLRAARDSEHVLAEPAPDWSFARFGQGYLEYDLTVHVLDGAAAAFAGELQVAVHGALGGSGVELGEGRSGPSARCS
jgi:hypothetical protein